MVRFKVEYYLKLTMLIKKTLVIGGSTNPFRYSNKAIRKLIEYGHPVVSLGLRKSKVDDVEISIGKPNIDDVHTVTMYVGKQNQEDYFDYIINLKPKRIIFNPGAENDELAKLANENGIEVVENCTLVMLGDGLY